MESKKQDNKIIIFDWGGVIESHREGDYNIYEALTNIIKQFNTSTDEKEHKCDTRKLLEFTYVWR